MNASVCVSDERLWRLQLHVTVYAEGMTRRQRALYGHLFDATGGSPPAESLLGTQLQQPSRIWVVRTP
jgi:hypothetical protein